MTFLRKKRVLVIAGSSSSSQTMCTRFLKRYTSAVPNPTIWQSGFGLLSFDGLID